MYQIAAAPQSIGGVLDAGFKLFQTSFTRVILLAVLAALVAAPVGLLAAQPPGAAATATLFVGIAVVLVLIITFNAALIARMDAIAHGRELSLMDSVKLGFRAGPRFFLASVLYGLAVFFSMLLLVIPGLIVAVWLIFGPYVAVTEGRKAIASLKYSRQIVRGHWWRTTALLTIVGLIVVVIYVVIGFIAGIGLAMGPAQGVEGTVSWFELVVSPVVSAIATPLGYSLLLATLYDLKLRHEGGDIAERIAATA